MIEEWRPIVRYEGLYEISNLGRVKSLERIVTYTRRERNGRVHEVNQHVKETFVKLGRRKDGYADVPLSKNGVTTLHCVHRLLAEAWIPNPNNYNYVNHKDLDKTNNSLDNLEWISCQGNVIHAVTCYSNPQAIPIYCKETDLVYASIGQCERELGLSSGTVTKILRNLVSSSYTLSYATKDQIQAAKSKIAAECGWTYTSKIKGRLHKIRKLKCIDTQQYFDTISEAAKMTCCCEDSIRYSIRNRSCCKGLTFYYLDDAPEDEAAYREEARNIYHCRIHRGKER